MIVTEGSNERADEALGFQMDGHNDGGQEMNEDRERLRRRDGPKWKFKKTSNGSFQSHKTSTCVKC